MDGLLNDIGRTGCAGVVVQSSPVRCAMDPTPWKGGSAEIEAQQASYHPRIGASTASWRVKCQRWRLWPQSGNLSSLPIVFGFLPHKQEKDLTARCTRA